MKIIYLLRFILLFVLILMISSFSDITDTKALYKQLDALDYKQLHAKGLEFEKRESFDSALVTYTFFVNKYKDSRDNVVRSNLLDSYLGLGYIYYMLANPTQSFAWLHSGLILADEIGNAELKAKVLNNISSTYFFMKEYDKAEIYLDSALGTLNDTTSILLKAGLLNNYGLIKKDRGDFEIGLKYIMESYNLIVSDNSPLVYEELLGIGECYFGLGEYDKALSYFSKIKSTTGCNSYWLSMSYKNKGNVHKCLNNYDSAIYYYDKVNEIALVKKYNAMLVDSYKSLSDIYLIRGDLRKALDYHKMYNEKYIEIYDYDKFNKIKDIELLVETERLDKSISYLNTLSGFQAHQLNTQYKVMGILIIVVVVFAVMAFIVMRQKREIKVAYNDLVSKNLEIVNNEKDYHKEIEKLKLLSDDYKTDIETIISSCAFDKGLSDKEYRDWILDQFASKYTMIKKASHSSNEFDQFYNLEEQVVNKYSQSWLNKAQEESIKCKILDFMQSSKSFLNEDFTIEILAKSINIHKNYISQTINQCFGNNFNIFINDYRIREARVLLSDPKYSNLTIEAIANMVGFKSKTSFNTHFKKITGVTPSIYQKTLSIS